MRRHVFFVLLLTAVHAQTPEQASPTFEVASVKQLEQSLQPGQYDLSFVGTSGRPFKIVGNRVTIRGTVHALIAAAYGMKDYQISSLPPWADRQFYLVTAKSPGEVMPSQEDVRPMLQALLADRFQLTFHRDTKELRVYDLVRAKESGV